MEQGALTRAAGSTARAPGLGAVAPEPGSARWWIARDEAAARRRPRAGGLSIERIIGAALDVLRSGGLDALTVRTVADRLQTSSASLYRHFASRDELIVLIGDHVLGDVRIDRTGRGWRADIEALMRDIRRVMLHQPLPPTGARNRSAHGPNRLRILDAALQIFLDTGMDAQQAALTTISVMEFVAGAADIQRSVAGRTAAGAIGSDGLDQLVDELPGEPLAGLRAAGAHYVAAPADEVFTHGLSLLLDGIGSRFGGSAQPRWAAT